MPGGALYQPKYGAVYGAQYGAGTGMPAGIPGVSRDGASSKYVPASNAEWTALMAAAGLATGNPSALYLCQEASGNLADSIGTFTLTGGGAGRTYQQPVSGWSRLSVVTTDNATSTLINTDAGLPDIGSASCTLLAYELLNSTPGGTRTNLGLGTTSLSARLTATPAHQITNGVTTGTGAANPSGAVRPVLLQTDKTAGTETLYTDQETVTTAFSLTPTGKRVWFGGVGSGASPVSLLYSAVFFNAAAELSLAQVRTLFQTLGFTVAW